MPPVLRIDRERLAEMREREDFYRGAARRVNAAARQLAEEGISWPPGEQAAWNSRRKVFIVDVARAVGSTVPRLAPLLVHWNTLGWVELARADLVGAMDPTKVRESEILLDNASYHFVVVDLAKQNPPRIRRPQRLIVTMEKDAPRMGVPNSIRTPADAVNAFSEYIGNRAHEYLVVLFLNAANTAIGYSENTQGALASVAVDIGGIAREALLAGARSIITAHQHPSGASEPSQDDRNLWMRLRTACNIVGIVLLDNLVLGEGGYYSEADEEYREYPRGIR